MEEDAGQGPEQGDGGEEDGGEGTPENENEIKSHTTSFSQEQERDKGSGNKKKTKGRRLRRTITHLWDRARERTGQRRSKFQRRGKDLRTRNKAGRRLRPEAGK